MLYARAGGPWAHAAGWFDQPRPASPPACFGGSFFHHRCVFRALAFLRAACVSTRHADQSARSVLNWTRVRPPVRQQGTGERFGAATRLALSVGTSSSVPRTCFMAQGAKKNIIMLL